MKCLSVLALVAAPLAASAAIISSSSGYNDPTQSLDTVACYDYFSAQGAKILGDLVPYPLLTVSTLVEGSDSLYCGSRCFSEFNFVTNAHSSFLPQVLAGVLHTGTRTSVRL